MSIIEIENYLTYLKKWRFRIRISTRF